MSIFPEKRENYVIARGIGEDASRWYYLHLKADYESRLPGKTFILASSKELSDIEAAIDHLCAGPIFP